MTPEQERSMQHALTEFVGKAEEKYRAGQAEHEGNLWEKDGLLEEAGKEVIDQMFYLAALRQRLSYTAYNLQSVIDFLETDTTRNLNTFRSGLILRLSEICDDIKSL